MNESHRDRFGCHFDPKGRSAVRVEQGADRVLFRPILMNSKIREIDRQSGFTYHKEPQCG